MNQGLEGERVTTTPTVSGIRYAKNPDTPGKQVQVVRRLRIIPRGTTSYGTGVLYRRFVMEGCKYSVVLMRAITRLKGLR